MNICFLYGQIINEIKFEFIINDKNKNSICYFDLKLLNGTIIKIKAYNEKADLCYGKLRIKDLIFIEGYLNNNKEVIIKDINFI